MPAHPGDAVVLPLTYKAQAGLPHWLSRSRQDIPWAECQRNGGIGELGLLV